jgi:hypothetical protein
VIDDCCSTHVDKWIGGCCELLPQVNALHAPLYPLDIVVGLQLQSRLDPSYQEASNYMQPQQQQRQSVRESYLQTPEYRVSIGESPVGLPMVPAGTPAGLGDGQGPLVRPSDISALGAIPHAASSSGLLVM